MNLLINFSELFKFLTNLMVKLLLLSCLLNVYFSFLNSVHAAPIGTSDEDTSVEYSESDNAPVPQQGRSIFFPKFLFSGKPKKKTAWTKMSGRSTDGFQNPNVKNGKSISSEEQINSDEIPKDKKGKSGEGGGGEVKGQAGRSIANRSGKPSSFFGMLLNSLTGGDGSVVRSSKNQKKKSYYSFGKPTKPKGRSFGRGFDEDDSNTDLDNDTVTDASEGTGAAADGGEGADTTKDPNATPKEAEEDFPTDSSTEGTIQPQFAAPVGGGGGEQFNLTCMEMEPEGGTAAAVTDDSWKWKNIHIWVPKDKGYTDKGISNLKLAVDQMKGFLPCMNWTVKVEEKGDSRPKRDHLYLDPEMDTVCGSFVGRVNPGPEGQKFSLSNKCLVFNVAVILHELLHALGWSHEQRREDRDDYIDILWFNVKQPYDKQFDVKEGALTGGPYDINSIMHYPMNWTKATMGGPVFHNKINPEQWVGPMNSVTATDKLKMKNIYCPNWDYVNNTKKVCKKKLKVAGWGKRRTNTNATTAGDVTTTTGAPIDTEGGESPTPTPPKN